MSERKWTNDSKSQAKKRLGNNVGSHNPRAHTVVCTHWREQKLCFILVAISCWYFFFSCCCRPINYLMFGAGLYILCAYICDFRIDFVAMLLSIVFHSDYAWMDWVMSEANIWLPLWFRSQNQPETKAPRVQHRVGARMQDKSEIPNDLSTTTSRMMAAKEFDWMLNTKFAWNINSSIQI